MKILTKWLRAYLPGLPVDDARLAEDLTLRGIAVEGIYDLGAGNGSLYEMDITTNRVDAMPHYGVAREAAAIYGLALPEFSSRSAERATSGERATGRARRGRAPPSAGTRGTTTAWRARLRRARGGRGQRGQ